MNNMFSVGAIRAAQNLSTNKPARELFVAIVRRQVVDESMLTDGAYSRSDLRFLVNCGLIVETPSRRYVISAKGLKLADDLESLSIILST